jgi:hypothetical protein
MTTPQFPTEAPRYPEPSQATTILILGILGIVLCAPCAPFAWVMGNKELNAINSGMRDPANAGTAKAGKILGIIGTVLLAVGLVVAAFLLTAVIVTTTSGI